MGACGANPLRAPFFHGATFRFWSFSRVETSGGIRASLAGRYASALFDLARDQRQIDSVGRSLDALSQTLVDSKDFAELVSSPLRQPRRSRQGFRRARSAARPRSDHRQFPRRPRPQRPQGRTPQRDPRLSPACRRASRRNYRRRHHRKAPQRRSACRAQGATSRTAPAATSRSTRPSIPPSSAESSSSWAASRSTPRSAPNSTVSHPR